MTSNYNDIQYNFSQPKTDYISNVEAILLKRESTTFNRRSVNFETYWSYHYTKWVLSSQKSKCYQLVESARNPFRWDLLFTDRLFADQRIAWSFTFFSISDLNLFAFVGRVPYQMDGRGRRKYSLDSNWFQCSIHSIVFIWFQSLGSGCVATRNCSTTINGVDSHGPGRSVHSIAN